MCTAFLIGDEKFFPATSTMIDTGLKRFSPWTTLLLNPSPP
jgi:hypothetical protein